MKKLILTAASMTIALTGCVTPTEQDRFALEVSQQICNVDALAEEKKTSLATTNDYKNSIAAYQNKFGTYEEQTDTILMEKLNRYEAEIEGSYRFVTQQCGAYMRCLESNGHDEWRCKRAETRWSEAQGRFNQISWDVRTLAAEVERERIRAENGIWPYPHGQGHGHSHGHGKKHHHPHGKGHHHGHGKRHGHGHGKGAPARGGCCDTLNTIFTDCCG